MIMDTDHGHDLRIPLVLGTAQLGMDYGIANRHRKPGLEEAIENIDIGGPAMLRSSAKNFRDVTVIVDPADYEVVLKEMEESGGATSIETRYRLARKVFNLTHQYDGAISRYLSKVNP